MYILTKAGEDKVKFYHADALVKQKEILSAGLDTNDDMFIPDRDCVINDLNNGYVDADGNYQWLWSVTDNFQMDYPLCLKKDEDFVDD